VAKRSSGEGFLPSFIADRLDGTVLERITAAAGTGKIATTSIGGALSGTILASEVLMYLLRDTDLVNRDIIFAPRFTVIDLLKPAMEVVDIRTGS
jgi:hypothetical protein